MTIDEIYAIELKNETGAKSLGIAYYTKKDADSMRNKINKKNKQDNIATRATVKKIIAIKGL